LSSHNEQSLDRGWAGPGDTPGSLRLSLTGRRLRLSVAVVLLVLSGVGQSAAETKPLRLCADPDNLPFSSNHPETPGLYLEIGEAIGRVMGRPTTAVWNLTYFGKRSVRTTLLAGQCDASVGLPDDQDFMGPRVIFSKPLLQVGYALVTPKSTRVSGLNDLRGRSVAVQFASTPQSMLAQHDNIRMVTFREPEEAMRALAAAQVDVAFIWGPTAGYMNKTVLQDTFNIVPVAGPGMQWPAAVAFPRGQALLCDEVNRAIDTLGTVIDALKLKYGFPTAEPITLSANGTAAAPTLTSLNARRAAAPLPAAQEGEQRTGQTTLTTEADIAEGQDVFNGICAHCHGPNAVQAERRIDLRLLRHRYGGKMDETYLDTVTKGRPAKGMPNWSEVLTTEQINKILVFLHTVQVE
jgi:polar amino acid transport system substrate-binding protein